jgi:hypothetical protein
MPLDRGDRGAVSSLDSKRWRSYNRFDMGFYTVEKIAAQIADAAEEISAASRKAH